MKSQPKAKHYPQAKPWQPMIKDRVYLDVPFDEKEAAKALGAWWDGDRKLWYTTIAKINKFPQVCRWMNPGEQKLWAKSKVAWLVGNDPAELIDIERIISETKDKAEMSALGQAKLLIAGAMIQPQQREPE